MTSPSNTKGPRLEFQTAAYFQRLGYLVRRGVNLVTSSGTGEVTDIDLLAIKFSMPLAEERIIIDCKDKRKPRPYERILWVRGLSFFANADRQIVVLPHPPWQARDFGSLGNVELLNSRDLLEHGTFSEETAPSGFGDADQQLEAVTSIRKKHSQQQNSEAVKNLAREELKLNQMLVEGHPVTNLNRIIVMLSEVGKNISGNMNQESDHLRWLRLKTCCNAAVVASVMFLRFACENKWTPESDWTGYAEKKLTYGDVSPRQAQQLAEKVFDKSQLSALAPKYTEELIGVIKTLIEDQDVAAKVPYALDYYLFGLLVPAAVDSNKRAEPQDVGEKSMKTGKQILSALSYSADLSNEIWNIENFSKGSRTSERQSSLLEDST